MSLLVVGSLAFDSVETPHGKREKVLGGSANYFSMSASFHASVRVVGVVGNDFPEGQLDTMKSRGIDVEGVQRVDGETFHWSGYYGEDMNQAHTLETRLNVFETFAPELPDAYCNSDVVFLANIDPDLQLQVLDQCKSPRLVACDTMNFWISGKRESLLKVLERVDLFLANEQEVRDLSGEKNLLAAAAWLRDRGPKNVIIKRGEYGAMLVTQKSIFNVPAFPLELVRDPTGAGDTFAGGAIGYLAGCGEITEEELKRSLAVGTVMASYNVEHFSFDRLLSVTPEEIQLRYKKLHNMMTFSHEPLSLREV
jgi:sugar/nucleoside kinase (ribokinase family)